MVAEIVPLVREALARLLDLEADVKVVATVGAGDDVVDTALLYRPDVAVTCLALPKRDGIETAAELKRRLPSCKTLVLAHVATPGNLRRAAEIPVAGLILMNATPEDLVDAVRTVAAGGSVIDPQLAYAALSAPPNPLTERETSVLRMTADGLSTREIAQALFLSHGTVRNYLASAVTRLCARNRVDAIRVAREAGWL